MRPVETLGRFAFAGHTMRAFIQAIAEAMRQPPSRHCADLIRDGHEGEGID